MERCLAILVFGIHDRAGFQEQFGNGLEPISRGPMQWCPTGLVRAIDLGVMGQKQLDRASIFVPDRLQEQRHRADRLIRVGTGLKQRFEGWCIPQCFVKQRLAVGSGAVEVGFAAEGSWRHRHAADLPRGTTGWT